MPSIISAESPLTSTPSRACWSPPPGKRVQGRQKQGVLPGEGLPRGLILAPSSPRNTGTHLFPAPPACASYIGLALLDPESPLCPPWCFGQVLRSVL